MSFCVSCLAFGGFVKFVGLFSRCMKKVGGEKCFEVVTLK